MSDQPQIKYEEKNDKSTFLKWGFPLTGSGIIIQQVDKIGSRQYFI